MKKAFFSLFALLVLVSCNFQTPIDYSVSIDRAVVEMQLGEEILLNATATQPVTWTSSDEAVATVWNGIVTCTGYGQATITAATKERKATCLIVATEPPAPDYGPTEHGEYQLVWSEEFDGTELDLNTWNIEVNGNGGGNNEKQYYTDRPENLRVRDGNLEIEVRKEEYNGKQYTSARINTKNKKDFTYGRIEARIAVPHGRGTWPAFWMLGYGMWPACGEIDIMEHIGSQPLRTSSALHCADKNGSRGNNYFAYTFLPEDNPLEDEYHIYAVEWCPNVEYGHDHMRFYVDDIHFSTITSPKADEDPDSWPFFKKEFIILNCAIGGNMGGSIDDNIFNDPNNPIIMKVDYVRVYQKEIY